MTEAEIRRHLLKLISSRGPEATILATVGQVNPENATCDLIDDNGQEYYDVRLLPTTGGNKSFLQIPAIGSFVLAVRVEDTDDWAVIVCTKIDQIELIVAEENIGNLVKDLITAIRAMKFTTNMGPTITLINDAQFITLEERFKKIFLKWDSVKKN